VLAHTRRAVDEDLPSPFQFNHCVIAISLSESSKFIKTPSAVADNWLIFDPTDENIQPGELPSHLQGSRVLLGIADDSTLIRLPRAEPSQHKIVRRLEGEILADGTYNAAITISQSGEWASQQRYLNKFISSAKQIERWKREFSDVLPGLEIINLKMEDHPDSILMRFKITGTKITQKSGNYIILHPDVFRIAEAPELTGSDRQQPIWFGQPRQIETFITWRFPAQWKSQEDSMKFQQACKGGSLSLQTSCSTGILKYHSLYEQTGKLMQPEEYSAALDFSRKLSMLNSHAVLFTL
jgi:hypothetical protein